MRVRWLRGACVGVGVAAAGVTTVSVVATSENRQVLRLVPDDAPDLLKNVSKSIHSWSSANLNGDKSSSSPFSSASSPLHVFAATPLIPKSPDNCGCGDAKPEEKPAPPAAAVTTAAPSTSTSVQKWDDNWDLRDPEFLGLTEFPKATRNLILIRHGQYNLEADDDADRKLTELGRKQLQLTADRLRELSCQNNVKYDKIFVSTMTRAMESADIIACALPEVPRELPGDALLREGAPYPPEPPNWNLTKSKEQTAKKLLNYYVDGPRIESAFRKYFRRANYEQKEDSTEIVVCHANVIRYFAMRALQLPPEAWLRISLKGLPQSISNGCRGESGKPDRL